MYEGYWSPNWQYRGPRPLSANVDLSHHSCSAGEHRTASEGRKWAIQWKGKKADYICPEKLGFSCLRERAKRHLCWGCYKVPHGTTQSATVWHHPQWSRILLSGNQIVRHYWLCFEPNAFDGICWPRDFPQTRTGQAREPRAFVSRLHRATPMLYAAKGKFHDILKPLLTLDTCRLVIANNCSRRWRATHVPLEALLRVVHHQVDCYTLPYRIRGSTHVTFW